MSKEQAQGGADDSYAEAVIGEPQGRGHGVSKHIARSVFVANEKPINRR